MTKRSWTPAQWDRLSEDDRAELMAFDEAESRMKAWEDSLNQPKPAVKPPGKPRRGK